MRTTVAMIFALALISSAHAQQITNVGPGIAGNGISGTSPAYAIDILTVDHFDGDKFPTVYIVINGKKWLLRPPSPYSSAYCRVVSQDGVQDYGYITATTPDGTQFLGGVIFIKKATWRVISFKGVAFYKPAVMPFIGNAQAKILVYVYSNFTNTFVLRPDLTRYTPYVSGAIWLNNDYSLRSAIYDTARLTDMPISQLTIIPPPGGIGGTNPPVMPVRVR